MALTEPIYRYRPTRLADDHGGWTWVLGTPTTIFGIWRVHDTETEVILDIEDDVVVGDLLRRRED